jgi:hypothetical protein
MTVSPPTASGAASVAVKVWPGLLIFDPSASPKCTVSVVPAGTTTGAFALGSGALEGLDVLPLDAF